MWIFAVAGGVLGIGAFLLTDGIDIFPALALVLLVYILFRLPTLRGQFGKSPVTALTQGTLPQIAFSDIGGQTSAKQELLEALDFITDRERVAHLGIRPLRGVLLTGPPGTGKTLLAKAAANYTGSAFLSAAGSEFIEMYAGVGAQRVREMFSKARQQAKQKRSQSAIIFIDEIEVLAPRRGQHQGHLEYDQTVNQLLVEMDGLRAEDAVQILVMAATNRADLLDEAILRPGRFDRLVKVDLPDKTGRLEILVIHTKNKPLAESVDLESVAKDTFGFSGAHLESVANEAAILAFRRGQERIADDDFEEAIEKVIMGEKSARQPDPDELRRVAIHESGHALVSEIFRPGSVASITISPRGGALGYVRRAPDRDRLIETQSELEEDIGVALAGTLAEEVCMGSRSTGAGGDFEQAFQSARRIVLGGMSSMGVVSPDMISESDLHEATRDIVRTQEKGVRELIQDKRGEIVALAARLLEEERMDGEKLRRAVGLPVTPHGADPGTFDDCQSS